jgi:uncharacterized membrane protein
MPTAKNFFNESEKQIIINAISTAEKNTSGEIRVHIENFCFGNEVKRAVKVFNKLGMANTKERNGILIYLAVQSKKVAIIGDEGIHKKLGREYWDKLVEQLISKFHKEHKADGLAESIIECGNQLKHYFPYAHDDKDELSNEISH